MVFLLSFPSPSTSLLPPQNGLIQNNWDHFFFFLDSQKPTTLPAHLEKTVQSRQKKFRKMSQEVVSVHFCQKNPSFIFPVYSLKVKRKERPWHREGNLCLPIVFLDFFFPSNEVPFDQPHKMSQSYPDSFTSTTNSLLQSLHPASRREISIPRYSYLDQFPWNYNSSGKWKSGNFCPKILPLLCEHP